MLTCFSWNLSGNSAWSAELSPHLMWGCSTWGVLMEAVGAPYERSEAICSRAFCQLRSSWSNWNYLHAGWADPEDGRDWISRTSESLLWFPCGQTNLNVSQACWDPDHLKRCSHCWHVFSLWSSLLSGQAGWALSESLRHLWSSCWTSSAAFRSTQGRLARESKLLRLNLTWNVCLSSHFLSIRGFQSVH